MLSKVINIIFTRRICGDFSRCILCVVQKVMSQYCIVGRFSCFPDCAASTPHNGCANTVLMLQASHMFSVMDKGLDLGQGLMSNITLWAGSLATQTVQPALLTMGVPTLN